jgi:hypothetical protein
MPPEFPENPDPPPPPLNGSGGGSAPFPLEPLEAVVLCPDCGAAGFEKGRCVRCGIVDAPEPDAPADDDAPPAREKATAFSPTDGDDAPEDTDESEDAAAIGFEGGPICVSTATDRWLPPLLVAIGALIVLTGGLAGARGLFPSVTDAVVPWTTRLTLLIRYPVLLALATVCVAGGLVALAWLEARRVGPPFRLFWRAAAVAALAGTTLLIGVPWRLAEFTVEALGAAGVMWGATIVLFRLRPRDALTSTGLTAAFLFVAVMIVEFLAWCV